MFTLGCSQRKGNRFTEIFSNNVYMHSHVIDLTWIVYINILKGYIMI